MQKEAMTDEELEYLNTELRAISKKLSLICDQDNIDFVLENMNKLL